MDTSTSPFSIRELLARIKAHLRRSDQAPQIPVAPQEEIRFKSLVIDKELRKASLKNKRIDFTPKEFDLLLLLADNPGKTFNRTELLKLVWGYSISGYEHTVTSHINRIRTKLETDLDAPQYIITSWGYGIQVFRRNISLTIFFNRTRQLLNQDATTSIGKCALPFEKRGIN